MKDKKKNIERNKFWEEPIAYFTFIDTDLIENDAFNNSVVACVFIVAEKCIVSRWLAKLRGYTGRKVISLAYIYIFKIRKVC